MKLNQSCKGRLIRQHLLSGKPLTQLEATLQFGYLRLGALVFDMRHKDNIPVVTEYIEQADGSKYAKYYIKEVKDEKQLSLF